MAKMSSTEFIVTIIVGVLLIMAALYFGTADLKPFEGTNKGLTAYPYEGFADAQAAYENRTPAPAPAKPMADKEKEKEGFAPLIGASLGETPTMSFLAMNEASSSCPDYGYTKSNGNICMSSNDLRLLTTRGGNATGM